MVLAKPSTILFLILFLAQTLAHSDCVEKKYEAHGKALKHSPRVNSTLGLFSSLSRPTPRMQGGRKRRKLAPNHRKQLY